MTIHLIHIELNTVYLNLFVWNLYSEYSIFNIHYATHPSSIHLSLSLSEVVYMYVNYEHSFQQLKTRIFIHLKLQSIIRLQKTKSQLIYLKNKNKFHRFWTFINRVMLKLHLVDSDSFYIYSIHFKFKFYFKSRISNIERFFSICNT